MKHNGLTMASAVVDVMIGVDQIFKAVVWEYEPKENDPVMDVEDQIGAWYRVFGFITIKFSDGSMIQVHDVMYKTFMEKLQEHIYEINCMAFAS